MIQLNQSVLSVCQKFRNNGFQIYLVGGAVRDFLLGKESHDIDLTTDAMPEQMLHLFKDAIPTGLKYGTITILAGKAHLQVTTFRKEGSYVDSRHPSSVSFGSSLKEDVIRRDFTINALAYDPITKELIDWVDGKKDLDNKLIRTVGDPLRRFREDSLRIFRLFRFVSQLGFNIEYKTLHGVEIQSDKFTLPSFERILVEMNKLIEGVYAEMALTLMNEAGALERIMPPLQTIPIFTHKDKSLRWATLLKEVPNPEDVLTTLRFSSKDRKWILSLIKHNLDEKKAAFTAKNLKLSGQDIQNLGFKGKEIGTIQTQLKDFVLQDFSRNNKEILIDFIKSDIM